jgi:hypothetical protein
MAWFSLLIGTGMSMVFVAGWRIVFPMTDPLPEPALIPYRRAWRINLLWVVGALALLAADRQLLGSNNLVDFVMGVVLFPLFAINLSLRAHTMSSLWRGPVLQTLGLDPKTANAAKNEGLLAKINRLSRTAFSGFWAQFFERLIFVWIALPMSVVLAGVTLGRIPAESLNWMLWVSTAGGFAVLCKTWTQVKKINDSAAAEIQHGIVAPN